MKSKDSELIIKRAFLQDTSELREVGINSYLPHYTHLWKQGGVEWYLERCFGDENLKPELADSNIEYYTAVADNKNVGILKLVLHKPVLNSPIENALYLEKIYFVKEWTGKGAGQKLIRFTLNRARELKRDCVWLMAMDTSDKAIAAYKNAGFIEHSRTKLDSELMKEEFRGMVVMRNCFKAEEQFGEK